MIIHATTFSIHTTCHLLMITDFDLEGLNAILPSRFHTRFITVTSRSDVGASQVHESSICQHNLPLKTCLSSMPAVTMREGCCRLSHMHLDLAQVQTASTSLQSTSLPAGQMQTNLGMA